MSDFSNTQKKFTKFPAPLGVSPLAKSSAVATDVHWMYKWIKLQSIDIPPEYTARGFVYAPYVKRLMAQWNVTFDEDWYILNIDDLAAFRNSMANSIWIFGGCLCVKWRVGTTVYRYKLLDDNYPFVSQIPFIFSQYTNQRIKKNFCFEFWSKAFPTGKYITGIKQDILFKTSLYSAPLGYDDVDTIQTIDVHPLLVDDLGNNLPEALPYNQPNIAWLDNV